MAWERASRKAAPGLIELAGLSGSGKTYTALLVAAGMVGKKGRVGFLDAENGRGELYADDPVIMRALPDGYDYEEIAAPFTPERYIEKMVSAEKAGITVLVTDSASHEYEGIGGCVEIAETNKIGNSDNWALAKRRHKRFVYHLLSSQLQQIFCLRAREKVKIVGKQYIPLGLSSIQEKNFSYEMTMRWMIEEGTHHSNFVKGPSIFSDMTGRMLTKEDGVRIANWISGGAIIDPIELLKKRARAIAEEGMNAYKQFFEELTKAQQVSLASSTHAENKRIAEEADKAEAERLKAEAAEAASAPVSPETGAPVDVPVEPVAEKPKRIF